MVVLGDGVPAARRMRAPGVVVLGADRPDAKILPDEVLGGLGVELVEGRFLGWIVLIQPLLQREAEAALDDGVGREAALLKIGGGRHPAVIKDGLIHSIKDGLFRPAEKG